MGEENSFAGKTASNKKFHVIRNFCCSRNIKTLTVASNPKLLFSRKNKLILIQKRLELVGQDFSKT